MPPMDHKLMLVREASESGPPPEPTLMEYEGSTDTMLLEDGTDEMILEDE